MMEFVTLTEAEHRICKWVGEQRYDHAVRAGRNPGLGPSRERCGPHNDIRGACCEFAAARLLNLCWCPHIGRIDQPDVGGLVEVRSTDLPDGRLIVKPDGIGPYMLVIRENDYAYRSPGWIAAHIAKANYPLVTEFGDAAHYVPQHDLRPLTVLRAVTHDLMARRLEVVA